MYKIYIVEEAAVSIVVLFDGLFELIFYRVHTHTGKLSYSLFSLEFSCISDAQMPAEQA